MSTVSAPFGMRPAYHPSGIIRPAAYSITSGYATNILSKQPVKIVPSSTGEGSLAAAAVGDRLIGTFQGVEWTDSDGQRRYSNKWTASTVGTDIVAYCTVDPGIIYEIEANAPVGIDDIGKQYDFTAASGSTVTGLSTQQLDVASAAANAALQVIGINPGPDNAPDDLFTIVSVRISEHQMVADVAAF